VLGELDELGGGVLHLSGGVEAGREDRGQLFLDLVQRALGEHGVDRVDEVEVIAPHVHADQAGLKHLTFEELVFEALVSHMKALAGGKVPEPDPGPLGMIQGHVESHVGVTEPLEQTLVQGCMVASDEELFAHGGLALAGAPVPEEPGQKTNSLVVVVENLLLDAAEIQLHPVVGTYGLDQQIVESMPCGEAHGAAYDQGERMPQAARLQREEQPSFFVPRMSTLFEHTKVRSLPPRGLSTTS
jgi:hypothetical protein